MKLPDVRIAPNDPTLAHAAAYGRIKELRGNTKLLFDHIRALKGKTSIREGVALMKAHFGKLILVEGVIRLKGSRPKARWLVLDANIDGGSDMVAMIVEINAQGWAIHDLTVRLTSHAVARLMQRTTKSSSMQRFAETLRYHILAALPLAYELAEGQTLTTMNGSGALIWVPYENGARAMTWLGVESISDPVVAARCRAAGDTKVALHLTNANGEPAWTKQVREAVEDAGGTLLMKKQSSA
jgi:hypothetical protein